MHAKKEQRRATQPVPGQVIEVKNHHDVEKVAALFALAMKKLKKASAKVKLEVKSDESWNGVDSGSADDVADCKKEFSKHPVREPKAQRAGVKYRCAGGAELLNEGGVVVNSTGGNGTAMPTITFQHAKVGVRMLSVRKLWTHELANGAIIPFVQKHGVYFVRLFIKDQDNPDTPGFTGQGA